MPKQKKAKRLFKPTFKVKLESGKTAFKEGVSVTNYGSQTVIVVIKTLPKLELPPVEFEYGTKE